LELQQCMTDVGGLANLPSPAMLGRLDARIRDLSGEAADQAPAEYLTNWRAILVALERKNNAVNREQVRHLNDTYGGPILFPGQGAQPKVNKAKLIEWWNGLEAQWAVGPNKARDVKPSTASRHNYGRAGVAIPEISGGEKQRRKDRKP